MPQDLDFWQMQRSSAPSRRPCALALTTLSGAFGVMALAAPFFRAKLQLPPMVSPRSSA
jgi:hypothetical protein